ncbi:hypothetical protein [Acinetobacter shaoyimingii]|uniref:hypothetical protein n=1 Tax=Acinetobacter shaoyimingii TaxID=2715164 RepID=UPI001D0E8373|nr:hypothetical protein [Acinetobacter shaoyimingii]
MKEIEKYVGYYLLVYLAVLAICGFFQYMSVCQGKSLSCAFSMNGINTIITTTAYVLTPIVAIVGFFSWKVQKQYDLQKEYAERILNLVNKISIEINYIYSSFDTLKTMDNKVVALREESFFNSLNITNQLNAILIHVKTLEQIKSDSEINLLFKHYEKNLLKLKTCLNIITDNYKEYYKLLPDKMKESKSSTQYIARENYELSIPFILAEAKLKRSLQEKIDIYEYNSNNIPLLYSEDLETYKKNFDFHNNTFLKELIQIIKM